MVTRKNMGRFPDRKISEAFLEFAWPLIELAGPGAAKRDIEQILKIAFTVWNSAVFDAANGNDHHVTSMRELTASDPLSAALVEQMLSRKMSEFADDQRLIGKYTVSRKNGEWRLRAEARDPGPRRQ
jgi:hypothetical protein